MSDEKSKIRALIINPLNFQHPMAETHLLHVKVGKPKDFFSRVNPDPESKAILAMVKHIVDGGEVMTPILPGLVGLVVGDFAYYEFLACVSNDGFSHLWPIKIPQDSGRTNSWNESERLAAREAENAWIKVKSNRATSSWDLIKAKVDLGAPNWSKLTTVEMIEIAYADQIVDSADHTILRKLRGDL